MSENIELEKKFFLRDKEQFVSILNKENFESIEKNTEEVDEYFTDINSEFIKKRVCLRIRRTNNAKMELTYKGKSDKSNQSGNFFAKAESNLTVPIGEYEELVSFLYSLGFYSYVNVEKQREVYSINRGKIFYNIMIDNIKNVGAFVEMEVLCCKGTHDILYLKKELDLLVSKFDSIPLESADMPYRDFVAKELYAKMNVSSKLKELIIDSAIFENKTFVEDCLLEILEQKYKIDILQKNNKNFISENQIFIKKNLKNNTLEINGCEIDSLTRFALILINHLRLQ